MIITVRYSGQDKVVAHDVKVMAFNDRNGDMSLTDAKGKTFEYNLADISINVGGKIIWEM